MDTPREQELTCADVDARGGLVEEDDVLEVYLRKRKRLLSMQGPHKRTRHLHIRDLYIRQIVNKGYAKLEYVKSSENLADFFTKILPLSLFRKFRDRIMGIQR